MGIINYKGAGYYESKRSNAIRGANTLHVSQRVMLNHAQLT